MCEKKPSALIRVLKELKAEIAAIRDLDDPHFDQVMELWHDAVTELKNAIVDKSQGVSWKEFETGWGAQSIQFAIDCIPEFHRVLTRYYTRRDVLKMIDIGAGVGTGANLFAHLHSSNFIYSKIEVDAIDHTETRRRWVKAMYPRINYFVANLENLPYRKWDIVYCSHVIEHVPNPRRFCQHLTSLCKGFAFVYAPYNEENRIPGHVNTITEDLFDGMKLETIAILNSMAWHADILADKCILAVIDCR